MTSWFIDVEASVISGAPLYSKSIGYLFPVGKRQVLFAKRSYIDIYGFEPVRRQQKSDQPEPIAFFSMLEHPEGASELIFSLPFMLSKHLSAALVVSPRISPVFQKFTSSLRVNFFLLS